MRKQVLTAIQGGAVCVFDVGLPRLIKNRALWGCFALLLTLYGP